MAKKAKKAKKNADYVLGSEEPYELVKRRLEELGWTIYRLEKETGVPKTTIHRFMRGESELFGSTLFIVLRALGYTITET